MLIPATSWNLKKWDLAVGALVFLLFFAIYTQWTLKANWDLTGSHIVLTGDENVIIGNIRSMLAVHTLQDKIYALFDRDPVYGMLCTYTAYWVGVPAAQRWGEPGMIFTIRMAKYFVLVTALFLLCRLTIGSWMIGALLFGALLSMPSTAYYAFMPKPDQEQLLLIVIFFFFTRRCQYRLGWHWVFLGLAFGTKASAASLIPYCGLIALWTMRRDLLKIRFYRDAVIAGVVLIGGFFVAQWTLLDCFIRGHWNQLGKYLWFIAIQSVPKLTGFHHTFMHFMGRILWDKNLIGAPSFFRVIFILLAVAVVCKLLITLRWGKMSDAEISQAHFRIFIFGAGLILLAPIAFLTADFSFFHLHGGMCFLLAGLISFIEQDFRRRQGNLKTFWKAPEFYLLVWIGIIAVFAVLRADAYLNRQAKRTQDEHYFLLVKQSHTYQNILQTLALASGQKLRVIHNGNFEIDPTPWYSTDREFSPCLGWLKGVEVVITYPHLLPEPGTPADALYQKYVGTWADFQQGKQCLYIFYDQHPGLRSSTAFESLVMLIRADILAKTWHALGGKLF
ncbi:MAG: hypothetical protein HQL23_04660 [Candidatus Omnitrophica bacterium]|nr:hypothetical protein [Candidatus Omnitrophota bacterium]